MPLLSFDIKPSTVSVALSLLLMTGCATTKSEPDPWAKDKPLIIQSLQDAHVNYAQLTEKVAQLDQRVVDLERENREQATKLVVLEAAVQKKASEAQITTKPKAKASKVTPKPSLNQRLDALSLAASQPVVAKPKPAPAASDQDKAKEKNAYTAAYLALKSGRYDESSARFVQVIKAHPNGEYTDQAYYWLGESLVALLRYPEALEAFSIVANQYPKSAKHAAALLKIASVYKAMKQPEKARKALVRVIKAYPDGRIAERARAELKLLSPQSPEVVK